MLRVGLTGGMGAGKSTVAAVLEECGAVIVDADAIAREVVAPGTPGLAALAEAFGSGIIRPDGELDRAALAAKAFRDDESRLQLNSITHPSVGKRTTEIIESASADAIVVQDIPLLIENGLAPMFNLVVVVQVDAEERVRRLVRHRGIQEQDARARIAAQATDEQRSRVADVLLDNAGAPGAVEAEVRRLYADRLVPFERHLRDRLPAAGEYRLRPADPTWPMQADRLIARVQFVCGADAMRVDHIGSTAVQGLDAKDVLDLQITVSSLDVADGLGPRLNQAGFPRLDRIVHDEPKPTDADPTGRDTSLWAKRLHQHADPGRPANVHLRVDGSPGRQFALDFRDWLRAEPGVRAEYLEVKRAAEAATIGLTGRAAVDAYQGVKEPWFDAAYPRATQWSRARESQRDE